MPPDSIRPDAADRALGSRLASGINNPGAASPQQLRAQLPGLLGQDHLLQAPLHDLVGRPGFRRLLASGGEQERGVALDRLLRELAETYSPGVTARLGDVLTGLLDSLRPRPTPGRGRAPSRSRSRLPALAALTVGIALSSGLVFALARSNRLCPSLGLCLSAGGEAEASIDANLSRAVRAAGEVESAMSLEAFVAGLDRLDASLLNLVSRRLNPRQERQRQRLQAQSDGAHRRLRLEQRAQRSLEEAAALIGELERTAADVPQRFDVLAEARARLDEVSSTSFARSSVGQLERRLDAIQNRPPRPKSPPGSPEIPSAPPPPSSSGETTPASPTLPPPPSPSPTPSPPSTPPPAAPPPATPPSLPAPASPVPPIPPPPIQPPPVLP